MNKKALNKTLDELFAQYKKCRWACSSQFRHKSEGLYDAIRIILSNMTVKEQSEFFSKYFITSLGGPWDTPYFTEVSCISPGQTRDII